jgi:hypothetical protein
MPIEPDDCQKGFFGIFAHHPDEDPSDYSKPNCFLIPARCADKAGSRIIESKCVIVDELVHSVLMQPNGIGIASDKFVDVNAIYCFRAPNSHLFPLNEYKHELLSSFALRGVLSRGELLLPSRHIGNDP